MQAVGQGDMTHGQALPAQLHGLGALALLQLEALLVDARLTAIRVDRDAGDINGAVDADKHQRFESALAGPDFDAILFFPEIDRARSDPDPAGRGLPHARRLRRSAQTPQLNLSGSRCAKMEPVGYVNLLNNPAHMAKPDRV